MKKSILFVIAFTVFISAKSAFAQEKVSEIKLKLEKNATLFEIVDAKSKELLLYYRNSEIAKVFKTNEKLEIIDSLFLPIPGKKYRTYCGDYKKDDIYSIYWSNYKSDSIYYQNIDFKNRERKFNNIYIPLNKEQVIKTITAGNKFYVITIPKKGTTLTLHELTQDKYQKRVIDLSKEKFFLSEIETNQTIWDVFSEGYNAVFDAQTISDEVPTALPLTLNKRKVYINQDNQLIFTFDISAVATQILSINLTDYSYTLKNCKKTILKPIDEYNYTPSSNTNSFICNDNIFQLISDNNTILVDVKDKEFNTLKNFKIEKDKEIDFINSDILREDSTISNTRVLDKSSQFIRKLNNLFIGLTSYYNNGKYYVTLGGFGMANANNNNIVMAASIAGGLIGGLIAVAIAPPSYSMQNVNSYAGRKVVYANALFDQNFNPIPGKVNQLAFDKLRFFIEAHNELRNPMAFIYNANLFFGGYNKKQGILTFYKFND